MLRKLLSCLVAATVTICAFGQATAPRPSSVTLNAIEVLQNNGTPYSNYAWPGPAPMAAVMGSTLTATVKLIAPNNYNGWYKVSASYNGVTVPVSPSGVTAISMTRGQTETVTWQVGPLPSYVAGATLAINYAAFDATSILINFPLYLTYSAPTYPQTQPWFGVIESACAWANGDSTADNVARDLTNGEFNSGYFYYPSNTGSYWTDGNKPSYFLLTSFLQQTGEVPGNCMDVSDYLSISMNALGLNYTVAQWCDSHSYPPSHYTMLSTNPVCLIGNDPSVSSNYVDYNNYWGWHQVVLPGGGNVYDVCAAQLLDLTGASYKSPPKKWPFNGFWQTPGTPILGLFSSPDPTVALLYQGFNIYSMGAYTVNVE